MKKLIRHVIPILITVMTVFSVIPVHAELIPRESIPENTPQEAVNTAESFIKDTLIKVQNGLGYADARAETNKILFNAFLNNQTNGYSYGLLTIIANNALFEYRDLYLRSDYYSAAEEQVKVLISDLITAVETGVLSYEKAKEEAYTRIYKSVDPSYDPSEKEFVDFCYWDIPSVDSAYFNRARKLLLIALKWQDELYETKFLGVELATTRTGMVSITAILEPVTIEGTVVTRAYLHNVDIFNSFKFGIGDTVKVYKANMIIPQIAENATMSNTYKLPMICPCCGEPLNMKASSGGTMFLFCENQHCTARLVQKFAHFCEKTRMNIEGLSEITLEKFIGHGWIHNFGDLYDLEKHKDEIINTDGFGEKSYIILHNAIEKSRKCTLDKFIAALGIPMVGRHAGRILNEYFKGDWTAFEKAIAEGFDFTNLPDFGEIMNKNIYNWYSDEDEAKTV